MVRAGAFELHLCVGGIKQLELVTGAGVAYVESKFAVSGVSYKVQSEETDPFGEVFTQEWPVTPYTLRITNHSADMAFAKIFCDGFAACSQYISPGDNEVKGFKDSTGRSAGFREFLWSPPRRVNKAKGENPEPQFNDAEKAALKESLESIRVEIYEAKFQRTEERVVGATTATGIANGMEAVNKAVAKAADAASATCAGREVAGKATKAGLVKYSIYDVAKTASHTLLLRYSQRRKLENLGLLQPCEASGERTAVPRRKATAAGAAGEEASPAGKKPRFEGAAGGDEGKPIEL